MCALSLIGVDDVHGVFDESVLDWQAKHGALSVLQQMSPDEAKAGDATIIDVRGASEWAEGHVPGAVLIPLPELRGTKPGTLLVREWEGSLQRVMVLEQGFAWNGSTYDSLSQVARAITGTNWNGPRFFGLRAGNGKGART